MQHVSTLSRWRVALGVVVFSAMSVVTLDTAQAAETVTVTIDRSTVESVSNFHTGVTLNHHTFDNGEPAAVEAGKLLMTSSSFNLNVHLMGWGTNNPEPSPGVYAWESHDNRLNNEVAGAQSVTLTACCAPGWMKNAPDFGLDPDGNYYIEYAPLPEYYDDYANLVALAAQRYPQISEIQVWNEMKGFWDSEKGRWNHEGYTELYNLVWLRVKAVRPDIRIGGPYVVAGTNGGAHVYNSTVGGSWGTFDQRDLDAITYWLRNKIGADFIAIDGKNKNRDGVELVDKFTHTDVFADFNTWLRGLDPVQHPGATTLPLWWSEWYARSNSTNDSAAVKNAVMTTGIITTVRSGAESALIWGAEGDAQGNHHPLALFTDTSVAGGGVATPYYYTQQHIMDHFSRGTQLLASSSSSTNIAVLASPSKVLLANKTNDDMTAMVNGLPVALSPYQVKLIDLPPVDAAPPSIVISSPADNAIVSGKKPVNVAASISDNVFVTKSELFIDNKLVLTGTTNLQYTWQTSKVTRGKHVLSVSAVDSSGNTSTKAITVTVR